MRTAQQIFDTVVNHLRQQNARCESFDSVCLYRNDKGMKCAVGCLISDAEYSPIMERNSIDALLNKGLLPRDLGYELRYHENLLRSLQRVHDDYFPIAWEGRLQELAAHYNLTMPPPQETSNGQ